MHAASQIAARLAPFGESVFATFSRLAVQHGAVNLGQGFPNFDGPAFALAAATEAISHSGGRYSQYARSHGLPELNAAIAARFEKDTGLRADPDAEITVTSGCTEAIAATLLGLVNPGDEVVLVEPFYDSYPALVALAGGRVRCVRLEPPHFQLPVQELCAAIGPRTRLVLLNTPHNPTGRVFTREELAPVAEAIRASNAILVSDEVYEKLWYERPHLSPAVLPGMRDRTVVLSSLGKTFSLTGWKIGWAIAPPGLSNAIRAAHQFLTFASATPLQKAAAVSLACPDGYYESLRAEYLERRELILEELRSAGLEPFVPEGSYFVLCDHRRFGFADDLDFCRHLVTEVGVAAIPCSPFHDLSGERAGSPDPGAHALVRFAFCKTPETIREAGERLRRGLRPR